MLYTPAFAALFLVNLLTVSSFGAFFLLPLFVTAHGGSKGDIGIVMGIFALASTLCRPWVSQMIDHLGRKRSYLLGCLAMAVLPLGYLAFEGELADFYLPLLGLRILHGVALAICFTTVFTYIADLIPTDRLNEGIGMFGISGLVGLALGPVVAEAILERFGFDAFFILSASLAGMGVLIQLPLPDPSTGTSSPRAPSFFSLLGRAKYLRVCLLAVLFGFGLAATENFVAPLAEQRGIAQVSLFFLAYSVAAVLVRLLGGRLSDRVGEKRVLPYALLLTAGGLFALCTTEGRISLTAAGFLAGCGHGLLFPVLNTMAIRGEPFELRGKVTAIFTGGIDAGAFIGSILLGYIGDWFGFGALFSVSGLVLLGGLLLRSAPREAPE